MWVPLVLIGGGIVWYFSSQKAAAPVTPPKPGGIPGLPGVIPAGLVQSAQAIFAPAKPAAAAAPAGPASNGPYFNAYMDNINEAATNYNSGNISQDNFYALAQGYWSQAQADAAAGNMSKADLAQIQLTLQRMSVI